MHCVNRHPNTLENSCHIIGNLQERFLKKNMAKMSSERITHPGPSTK